MVVVTEIESFESRSAGRGRHRDETFRVADGRRIPPNVPKAARVDLAGLGYDAPVPRSATGPVMGGPVMGAMR